MSGTAAATAASTVVTLAVDNPDLTTVPTDGSAAIWIASSSGRRWSKITGKDNTLKTVTVETAYANTESGKAWGIGGKRATCAGSLQAFKDFGLGGWTIDIQTGETITADIVVNTSNNAGAGPSVIKSSAFTGVWGTQPILQTATSGVAGLDVSSCSNLIIYGLELKCTAGSPVEGNSGIVPKSGHSDFICVIACNIHGWYDGLNGLNGAFYRLQDFACEQCEIHHCTNRGVDMPGDPCREYKNYVHDNTNEGVYCAGYTHDECVYANNGLEGLHQVANGNFDQITKCTFVGNGASGSGAQVCGLWLGNNGSVTLEDNIFWNNGNGAGNSSGVIFNTNMRSGIMRNNAFGGSNQLASITNSLISRFNDITLTVDPRTSGTDFALNNTAGGGALCRAVSDQCANASATATAPDIGAIQVGEGGAGGGAGYAPDFSAGFTG